MNQPTATPATPAVLVLAFNRPEVTSGLIQALRIARPGQVFFAVDGPRPSRRGERERVAEVCALADRIDWKCDLQTLFRPTNLGCKLAVSEAITWFFEHVDEGIILEDDCMPHVSFFQFAAELLDRFRGDQRVMMVSGDNFQLGRRATAYDYYFSRYTHIWGWATWRRAWRLYDHSMRWWPELRDADWLLGLLGASDAARYWKAIFDETHQERNTSWAYRWTYSAWVNSGLTILPAVNLVSNIGFGKDATHTLRKSNRFAALPVQEMTSPLRHPPYMIRDERADRFTQRTMFRRAPLWRRAAKRVYRSMVRT